MFSENKTAGFILDEASRFAVPCFFIISGFFWRPDRISDVIPASLSILRKIGFFFVIWTIFYFAVEFSGIYQPVFTAKLRNFIIALGTGGPGYHLWFLPALIMGSILVWTSLRMLGTKYTVIACAALYSIGVAIGAYGPLIGVKVPTFVYRNGIFEAPLLLLCGYLMQAKATYVSRLWFFLLAVAGMILHLLEGGLTGKFPSGHDYSFGTLFFAIGLFGLFRTLSAPVGRWGADVLGAYLIHLFLIRIVNETFSFSNIGSALFATLCAAVLSLLISRAMKMTAVTRRLVTP
ncbi:Surface polysaccharide O-acyltransferase, integral membrane enzyme [Rhizobium sp. RU20A]|uniref:acyltransferase n=1 Tax=Rhizobium sp. RU20A TaxID=1907412 RepID=UPI0009565B44|nr:acyltransferase [Rhizobium sp. RU20A]SIQ40049.1 Surface polysaccharide O-acyltransferase, integral membrane enzyme [Rhizobium sp. RU20A]